MTSSDDGPEPPADPSARSGQVPGAADDLLTRYRLIAEAASDLVYFVDRQGRIQWASPSAERVLGRAPTDMVGMDAMDLVHPDHVPEMTELRRRNLDGLATPSVTWRLRLASGEYRWFRGRGRGVRDEQGAVVGLVAGWDDAQDLVLAERALADSLRRTEGWLNNTLPTFVTDSDDRFIFVNQALCDFLGRTEEEMRGRPRAQFVHPEERVSYQRLHREATEGRHPTYQARRRYLRSDGTELWGDLFVSVVRDANGDVIEEIGQIVDVRNEQILLDELVRARNVAEQANAAKSEFLSRMSHELRTPLTAILGFARLMQLDERPAEDADSLERILRAGDHLLDLINEVLDITRIESGSMQVAKTKVELEPLVREVVDSLRPAAATSSVELVVGPSADAAVCGDRQRLRQILWNLVGNAVKYNREGGLVRVAWRRDDDTWLVEVSDTGVGIAPELMERLFTPFDRLGQTGADKPGTGLGLAVSLALAQAMDGTLEGASEPGVGSTFTLSMPAADEVAFVRFPDER